ncbi:MAG: hypothetical protein PHX70_08600 [Clostridium sp.]|nr:hypothetical protein [Clostridium sp.]
MVNEQKIINLYEKYGTINQVVMRTGNAYPTIKKVLRENQIAIKPFPKPRYDYNKVPVYYHAVRYRGQI